MRVLFTCLLLTLSTTVFADRHEDLYRAAGWPEQRANFRDALDVARQRYQGSLPPAVYDMLLLNSNRRFAATAIDRRALAALRQHLQEPQPALAFYRSPLGRQIVTAEVRAASQTELARHAGGLPPVEASPRRRQLVRQLVRQLAEALPASQAGAEVSLALAGVAADSLSQMIPGVISASQAQGLLQDQRQRLVSQIEADIDQVLLHVYRDLSDAQLADYLAFARSQAGQDYYQAALQAIRAGLAVGLASEALE